MPTQPDPKWTPELQDKLFTEFVKRAQTVPDFAARCMCSPAEAKVMAQKVAGDLGLDVTIPEREMIILIPERRAANCHIYSIAPKPGTSDNPTFELKNHLICCYDAYVGADT